MTEKQFKKSVSGTLATGIILEKELSTEEVFNELIKLEKEKKELKQLIKKVIDERVIDYPLLCELKEMVKE